MQAMAKNTRPGRKTGKPGRGASPPRPGKENKRKGPAGPRRDDSRASSPKAPYQRTDRSDSPRQPSTRGSQPSWGSNAKDSSRNPRDARTSARPTNRNSAEQNQRFSSTDSAPERSGSGRGGYDRSRPSYPQAQQNDERPKNPYTRPASAGADRAGTDGPKRPYRASAASRSGGDSRQTPYARPRVSAESAPEAPRRPAPRTGLVTESVRPTREISEPVVVARPDNIVPDDIVWGRRTVIENLRSGKAINRIYLLTTAEGLNREFFHLAKEHNVPLVRCDKSRLDILSQGGNHQGLVAQLSTRSYLAPQQIHEEFQEKGGLLLALSGIQDPGNLGAALRTAEAAGVRQILLSSEQSCGLTATVSKTSAGADSWLDIARSPNLKKELSNFKDQGVQVVVTVPRSNVQLYEVDFTKPTVIVVGSEGWGLEPNLVKLATHQVTIPMQGQVESLNVSAATAIVLYEVVRQRLQANSQPES